MRNVFVTILATAPTALAWYGHPGMVTEASTTGAAMPLSSSVAFTPAATGGATTTALRLVTRATKAPSVTNAPSVDPTTLQTVARSHNEERDDTHIYSNAKYTWMSEYDGHLVTVKPCVPATSLVYHGTHPLTRLEGSRCRGCNRVLDPNDDGRYNGRFRGGHDGHHSHDEDLNDPQLENKCP